MIRQLLSVTRRQERPALLRMLVSICAGALLQGIAFALLVPVLERLLGPDPRAAWPWLAGLFAAFVVYAVVYYVSLRITLGSGAVISRGLHHRLGDHVASLPLGWFGGDRIGQLSALTTQSVSFISGAPAHLLRPAVTGVLTPAAVVIAMYAFDWRLALAATVTAPFIAGVYRVGSRLTVRADALRAAAQADGGGRVIEFAQLQPVLRASGRTGHGHRLLDDALAAQRDTSRRALTTGVPGQISSSLIVQAAFTTVLVYGTYLTLGGKLAAPTALAVLVLTARFTEPMAEAAMLGSVIQRTRIALRHIQDVLDAEPLPEPDQPRVPSGADIELAGVTFGYDGEPVLRQVSFRVPEHTMTALVGPSGSGKTTITRLIARFWDVGCGAVRIGGADVRDIGTGNLMAQIAMVFQDVYLFSGTIEENIRVGKPDATDEQVHHAARLARVEEIAGRLPDGWLTQVGEGGTALSGGERQRISIARAILKDAPIVLLDEATAALDPENEREVQEALSALTRDRTLLVIAHRLQTVVAARQILFLEEGRITERGTHQDLMAAGGRYAGFWAERHRAGGWRLAAGDPASAATSQR